MKYVGLLMLALALLWWFGLVFETDPQVLEEATNSRIERIAASAPFRIAASLVVVIAAKTWIR